MRAQIVLFSLLSLHKIYDIYNVMVSTPIPFKKNTHLRKNVNLDFIYSKRSEESTY